MSSQWRKNKLKFLIIISIFESTFRVPILKWIFIKEQKKPGVYYLYNKVTNIQGDNLEMFFYYNNFLYCVNIIQLVPHCQWGGRVIKGCWLQITGCTPLMLICAMIPTWKGLGFSRYIHEKASKFYTFFYISVQATASPLIYLLVTI